MANLYQSDLGSDTPSQLSEKDLFTLAINNILSHKMGAFLAGKVSEEKIIEDVQRVYTLLINSTQAIDDRA